MGMIHEADDSRRRVKISVRNLVEFVLRSGDIDNRRTAGAEKEAMQEGTRIHRKIQRQQGPSYRAEGFSETPGGGRGISSYNRRESRRHYRGTLRRDH